MEGYLYKWTNYIKGWRLRFFSVENYILYYSKEENNPNKKAIQLKQAILDSDKTKKSFTIEIGNKKIYLKTNSQEETSKWTNFLVRAISMSSEIENFKDLLNIKEDIDNNVSFEFTEKEKQPNSVNRKTSHLKIEEEINEKIKEFTKLIQCFQKTYFNLSLELDRMNSDINQNENDLVKNYYFNLLAIKQDLKVK